MQRLLLHRDVYFCEVDQGAVFLDLERERYFAVDTTTVSALASVVEGWPNRATAATECPKPPETDLCLSAIKSMIDSGVLTSDATEGKNPTIPHVEMLDSVEGAPIRPLSLHSRVRLMLTLSASIISVKLSLRRNSLRHLLAPLNTSPSHTKTPVGGGSAAEIGGIFRRLRPWFYSAEDVCLWDSLVMTEFLKRSGYSPTFILGIVPKPFAAHAWVQLGAVVMNDTLEKVQEFTPIFVSGQP